MSNKSSNFIPDTPDEVLITIVAVFIITSLFVFYSEITYSIGSIANKFRFDTSSKEIIFTNTAMENIRQNFNKRLFELGFCLEINGNKVVRSYVGDIYTSSTNYVVYNCPSSANGELHYHKTGITTPSGADIKSWQGIENMEVFCIYGGYLPACYEFENGELKTINVRVENS